MELFLLCAAVAYMVAGKHQKDTATAAYKAGKEPPGLVKARMRHDAGGGRRKPGNGKPQGPGAARLVLSSRWANACEKAKDRADDKHRRWRAWHAEQAPHRDEQWRTKQARRIAKSERRAEKFASARGIARHTIDPRPRRSENQTWDDNSRRAADADTAGVDDPQPTTKGQSDVDEGTTEPTPERVEAEPATPTGGGTANLAHSSTSTDTTGGTTVYEQAVQRLIAAADRVAEYRDDLASFADDLAGKGWGEQVTGPVADMDSTLTELEGTYRDLAAQMRHQGDQGAEAYDQAPWVPGPEAVKA